ncbi:hypothetical protein LCGC14_0548110 [marine sediment metagenome]|uniref:Uncharacterized protein n=1 Tax=marine sediment metagenome TaxID=412755 RepID=A0A0F9RQS6_9ZZZZ
MGDKYSHLHKKKNPKRTKEEISEDRIKRKKDKEVKQNGNAKKSKRSFKKSAGK